MRCGDHPRTRGEYRWPMRGLARHAGSPPHSRGILHTMDKIRCYSGITPALAGNTYDEACKGELIRDHPRTRGEYLLLC